MSTMVAPRQLSPFVAPRLVPSHSSLSRHSSTQLCEPVKWEQSTMDLVNSGIASYIEPGPGKQLKAMMRRIDQDAWSKTVCLEG